MLASFGPLLARKPSWSPLHPPGPAHVGLFLVTPGTVADSIRSALESHEALALSCVAVDLEDASPESVVAWLPIAARRLSGHLYIQSHEAAEGGSLELPCFENATSMYLSLGYLSLAVPPLGVFACLTNLFLVCIKLQGPSMLGDLVSLPRCPALWKLDIHDAWSLGNFAIHSDSLVEIVLEHLHDLQQQLTVMAPALKMLDVMSCFAKPSGGNRPVANISAPQLVLLIWRDAYDPRFTQFDEMENVEMLSTNAFLVYGKIGYHKLYNSYCMGILRRWSNIQNLRVILVFGAKDITNHEYLMEDITRFPKVINLTLDIMAKGHSCGPCLYHVLRMCTDVRKLHLTLIDERGSPEAQNACLSGCVCDQPPNWKTDEFVLNCLQEVKVSNLRGTENEAGLVRRLFDWATALEIMTVSFDCSVAESKTREFCQIIQSVSRPGICLKGPHFT